MARRRMVVYIVVENVKMISMHFYDLNDADMAEHMAIRYVEKAGGEILTFVLILSGRILIPMNLKQSTIPIDGQICWATSKVLVTEYE